MKAIYCTESQDRIPFEYFTQGKAIWSGGKPYLTPIAMQLGLKPDAQPPQAFIDHMTKSESGERPGPQKMKVNVPKAQSSADLSPIPASNIAMVQFQVPKPGEPPIVAPSASTVMGPGMSPHKDDEKPMISPPPIYVKTNRTATAQIPLPPPPQDDDELDATVPEVSVNKRVLPSPLEVPTLTPSAGAIAMNRPASSAQAPAVKSGSIPTPPAAVTDTEKTPLPEAPAVTAKAPTTATEDKPVSNDPRVAELNGQIEKIRAEIATLDQRVAEEQAKVDPAFQSMHELARKIQVESETAEATAAQIKAREAEESALRKRIEELVAIEAEAKAKLDAATKERTELEEKARSSSVQRAKFDVETKQRKQAENRVKAELENRKKILAEAEAARDAVQRERDAAAARLKAAEADLAKAQEEEVARKAADEKAAKERAEQVARAKKEAEEKARKEAEEREKKEAEEKAKREAEELAKAEEELRKRLEEIQNKRKEAAERSKK